MGGADGDQQALLDGEGSGGPPRRRQSMQRFGARGGGCGELPELAEDGMVRTAAKTCHHLAAQPLYIMRHPHFYTYSKKSILTTHILLNILFFNLL